MPSPRNPDARRRAGKIALVGAVILGALHQDFWFWRDATLVFGFLPVGLLYHILFGIAAALLFAFVGSYAWPATVADELDGERVNGADAP